MDQDEVKQCPMALQNLPDCSFPSQLIGLSHSTPKLGFPADFTSFSFNGLLLPNFSPTTSSSPSNLIPSFDPDPRDLHHCIPLGVAHDRRLKRMISNRESARRSRLRKKRQIEDLQGQVDKLRAANNQLSEKLIGLLESNHRILQENAVLKEKVSSLHGIVANLLTPSKALDNIADCTNFLKPEPSNQTR